MRWVPEPKSFNLIDFNFGVFQKESGAILGSLRETSGRLLGGFPEGPGFQGRSRQVENVPGVGGPPEIVGNRARGHGKYTGYIF